MNKVLISVQPPYAALIASGKKTVELRRRRPNLREGDELYLYVSLPVGAVIGRCKVDRVVSSSIDQLYKNVGDDSGLSRAAFRKYLAGAAEPTAIAITGLKLFKVPVPIRTLRKAVKDFVFPQSYRFVSEREASLFES